MKHQRFREWLVLSLYDELSEGERILLDEHLKECGACRIERGGLRTLHKSLAHRRHDAADDALLQDARRALRMRIHAESGKASLWKTIREAAGFLFTPPVRITAGAACAVAVGIAGGYFLFAPRVDRTAFIQNAVYSGGSVERGEPQISNVRFLGRDTQTGDVEFTFDTSTPVHIRGNINDERIQKILAHAVVADGNAGTRLRAVNLIASQGGDKSQSTELSGEVKSALITALLHDRNLGVRKEALNVLRNYLPDDAIVRAFLNVLANEKSTALKIAVINSLDLSQYENRPVNREILDMYRRAVQSDDNNYIRIKAKAALEEKP